MRGSVCSTRAMRCSALRFLPINVSSASARSIAYPYRTRNNAMKLRFNSPAPTSNASANAISEMTSRLRSRCCRRPPVIVPASALSDSCKSGRSICAAEQTVNQRRQQRYGHGKAERRRIHLYLIQPGQVARAEFDNRFDQPVGQQDAARAAEQCEQRAFYNNWRSRPRALRLARLESQVRANVPSCATARDWPRCAGDQQNEADRDKQHQQATPRLPDHGFAQWRNNHSHAGVRLRIFAGQLRAMSFISACASATARPGLSLPTTPMNDPPRTCRSLLRAGARPQFASRRVLEVRRSNADDRVQLSVQRQLPPDQFGSPPKRRCHNPSPMTITCPLPCSYSSGRKSACKAA